jgi:hypothetical protein
VRWIAGFLLSCVAVAAAPAAAQAGSYHVYSCAAGGGHHPNAAWTGDAVAGITVDPACPRAGMLVGLSIAGGRAIPNGTTASLTFTSPPGTTIADFTIDRELEFNSNPPLADTRPLYAIYFLGNTPFAGAGDYHGPTRDALRPVNAWYGYPESDAHLTRRVTRLRQMGALAGYKGDARTMTIRVGCFQRVSDCSAPAAGRVYHVLYGTDITINDPTRPAATVAAEGLVAGGPRSGSDPVVVSATDNAGIRRIELVDVTGQPAVVGARDITCDFRLPRPCPDVNRATVGPTALAVGRRSILVRTIDAGGNATDRGPFSVDVTTPSDRGAVNGINVSEPATLRARFPKGDRRKRTVDYGRRVRVVGQLVGASGQPITAAQIELVTRDERRGAKSVRRQTVTTGADGTFGLSTIATASRRLRLGWKARLNDGVHAAHDTLVLRTRAAASLRASTRRPVLGGRLVLRGRLRSPARGVTVILQGRRPGSRSFTTFADTTTRKGGRFAVGYRFRDPASRGRRFTFRAKLKPNRRYPFETGYSRRVDVRVR